MLSQRDATYTQEWVIIFWIGPRYTSSWYNMVTLSIIIIETKIYTTANTSFYLFDNTSNIQTSVVVLMTVWFQLKTKYQKWVCSYCLWEVTYSKVKNKFLLVDDDIELRNLEYLYDNVFFLQHNMNYIYYYTINRGVVTIKDSLSRIQ